jgi:hypothetical protein
MPRRKNIRELGVLTTQNASDHQYMGPIFVDGIEPELQSFNSQRVSLNADCARLASPFVSERNVKIKDYSVSRDWHRPYVEALFETDEAKLGALIAEAEWSIVGRFLELLISSDETDDTLDLQNAAYALTVLKKTAAVAYTPQHWSPEVFVQQHRVAEICVGRLYTGASISAKGKYDKTRH